VRGLRTGAAIAVLLVVMGCSGGGSTSQPPAATDASPFPGDSGSAQRLTAIGIVLRVTSTSPSAVSSFVLRTPDGQVLTIATESVTFDKDSFPPEHLREHQALAAPVKVTYVVSGGQNVAVRLEDAPNEGESPGRSQTP